MKIVSDLSKFFAFVGCIGALTAMGSNFLCASDLADAEAAVLDAKSNEDIFTQLQKKYDAASVPVQEKIEGWYSGRCFLAKDKNRAIGSVLAAEKIMVSDDNGPLFPPVEVLKFGTVFNHLMPNHYDTLTPKITEAVLMSLNKYDPYTAVETVENAYVSKCESYNIEAYLRQEGEYLFGRLHLMQDAEELHLKAGDIWSMCYWFKKIK